MVLSMERMSIWISLGIAIVILCALVIFERLRSSRHTQTVRGANSLFVIMPYKYEGTWVFDDPAVGLKRERFIAGIDRMIDKVVADCSERGARISRHLRRVALSRLYSETRMAAERVRRELVLLRKVFHGGLALPSALQIFRGSAAPDLCQG
jgi:hypothetical protein